MFHAKKKEANAKSYFEPNSSLFVKCTICSIYTTRDKYEIQYHESSEHHLRKLPKQKAHNQSLTGSLSYIGAETSSELLQPLPLPSRAHEVVFTSYPRFIAPTGISAAPAAGAAAAAAAAEAAAAAAAAPAAAVAPAEATTAAAADHGFSYVLEDPNYVFMPDGNSRDLLH